MKRESEAGEAEGAEGYSSSWIPNASFTTFLSLVGIGLTMKREAVIESVEQSLDTSSRPQAKIKCGID